MSQPAIGAILSTGSVAFSFPRSMALGTCSSIQTGTTVSTVDLLTYSVNSVTITGNTSSFTFSSSGGSLAIGSGGLTDSSASNSFISVPLSGSPDCGSGTGQLFQRERTPSTGLTTINSGASVWIGDGSVSGSITGNVTSSGTGVLAFDRSNSYTYSGILSGSLGVAQNGTGTTQLSGTNSYSGPTTVNNGTLQAGSTTAFGGAGLSAVTINSGGMSI